MGSVSALGGCGEGGQAARRTGGGSSRGGGRRLRALLVERGVHHYGGFGSANTNKQHDKELDLYLTRNSLDKRIVGLVARAVRLECVDLFQAALLRVQDSGSLRSGCIDLKRCFSFKELGRTGSPNVWESVH